MIDRVRALPGVVDAGAAQYAPFRGLGERTPFTVAGAELPADAEMPLVPVQRVSDRYFQTIGTPVLAGREFELTDRAGTPDVIVINQAFAHKYLSDSNSVGKTVLLGGNRPATIIGVVADIRQSAIAESGQPLLYFNNEQTGRVKVTLVARTVGNPLNLTNNVRAAMALLASALPARQASRVDPLTAMQQD